MEHPLRIRRQAANLSIDELARRVGVAKSTVSRIETWQADPSLSLVRSFCTQLPGLSANDFMVRPALAVEAIEGAPCQ
jgi:DNA-binding XRE family transcriptional regulator